MRGRSWKTDLAQVILLLSMAAYVSRHKTSLQVLHCSIAALNSAHHISVCLRILSCRVGHELIPMFLFVGSFRPSPFEAGTKRTHDI